SHPERHTLARVGQLCFSIDFSHFQRTRYDTLPPARAGRRGAFRVRQQVSPHLSDPSRIGSKRDWERRECQPRLRSGGEGGSAQARLPACADARRDALLPQGDAHGQPLRERGVPDRGSDQRHAQGTGDAVCAGALHKHELPPVTYVRAEGHARAIVRIEVIACLVALTSAVASTQADTLPPTAAEDLARAIHVCAAESDATRRLACYDKAANRGDGI